MIPLRDLIPNVPSELESGLHFGFEFMHDLPVVLVVEQRMRAAYDSANERFMYRLKQNMILMLKPFGADRYYIDGPFALTKLLLERQSGNNH